jgi:chemotaxis protein MotB
MKAGQAPIIVVRRTKKHHGFHGGAWKVAYADFVTAMMAFFLVMWLSAQDSRVRKAIAGYFQEPGVMQYEKSNSVIQMGPGGIDPGSPPVVDAKARQKQLEEQLMAEKQVLTDAAQHIRDRLLLLPETDALRDQVELIVTTEGLRIELMEKNGSSFFKTGSALLRGESVEILGIIAQELGKLPNTIVLEGHTDRQPYRAGAAYNNWDLSSDRANSARRAMEGEGLHAGQIQQVTGYADTYLRITSDPYDPRNRRVSILVRSQAAEALKAAETGGGDSAPALPVSPPPIAPHGAGGGL